MTRDDDEFWANIARQTLRVFFDSAPGGAKMLHETLCRVERNVGIAGWDSERDVPDKDRLQYLIALIEASGSYAPEGSRYRALYEQTRPKD